MVEIHKTAIVSKKAELGKNVKIGPYSIIGEGVVIGDETEIGEHVLIEKDTVIGKKCKIFKSAVLGTDPQDLKYKGEKTYLFVGDNTVIREFCTLNRGTEATGKTVVGNDCLLMSYVHIAHDCRVGNGVILANCATLAGHVIVDDFAVIGGLTPVHQFVRIGKMSIVGGLSRVTQDVPPFTKAAGVPLRVYGLNTVGLKRKGVSKEIRIELEKIYRTYYRNRKPRKEIRDEMKSFETNSDFAKEFILFLTSYSKRGITPDIIVDKKGKFS
ncbi:MAG: acyl-[acyl-carrier-protein]--UDP-N-acetylglucosamine O-acyltransferase [Caldiserica bacterium]|nr:MAG: acyl-[acyl-carrier-protein]--UDP-N-acetylglucosamine O-acyltransferase [Caldisericota bacterium]